MWKDGRPIDRRLFWSDSIINRLLTETKGKEKEKNPPCYTEAFLPFRRKFGMNIDKTIPQPRD